MKPEEFFNKYLSCKWSIAILFALLEIPERPSRILASAPGMSKKVFYERVSFMIEDGLIEKTVINTFPSHVEYKLTKKGKEIVPLLRELRRLAIGEEPLSHVFKCKWLKSILLALLKNTLRSTEIRQAIGNISNKVLSEKLKKLERFDLIEKALKVEAPIRAEYNLSPSGKRLANYITTKIRYSGNDKMGKV